MEYKKIAKMYGLLLYIKEEYEKTDKKESFYYFSRERVINEFFEKGFEWLLADERERHNTIAQEI